MTMNAKTYDVFATGKDIYKAAVDGARKGFNRTTDDYTCYEEMIQSRFEEAIRMHGINRAERRQLKRRGWKNAYLHLHLVMLHEHYETKEIHARVSMPHYDNGEFGTFFDIPLKSWKSMKAKYG